MRITLIFLVFLSVLAGLTHLWFKSIFKKYVEDLFTSILSPPAKPHRPIVDIEALPDLIREFADRSGADPNQPAHAVSFNQSAELRMAPGKAWQTLKTEQVTRATEPGFVWFAEQKSGPFTILRVVDAYMAPEGFLKARLFGSIPVANVSGQAVSHSELQRYLAELAWVPDAIYFNPHLRWKDLGNSTVQVEADSARGPAYVRLYFDRQGDLVEIQADEREAIEAGKIIRRPWRGLFSDYKQIGGRRIPAKCEVGYIYEDGYAAYFRGGVVEYKVISP